MQPCFAFHWSGYKFQATKGKPNGVPLHSIHIFKSRDCLLKPHPSFHIAAYVPAFDLHPTSIKVAYHHSPEEIAKTR